MKGIVYLIVRNDNELYVGITYNLKKRISAHKKTDRFKIGIKHVFTLAEYDNYEDAEKAEPYFIKLLDTYYNGLNKSINGQGNHMAPQFTTKGFKFTEKSRQRMRNNHWSTKMENTWSLPHSDQTKKRISESKKGKVSSCKLDLDTRLEIESAYKNDTITFTNEFISSVVKKSQRDLIYVIPFEELKSPNGKPMNMLTLYKIYFANKYNMTTKAMENILTGKFLKNREAYE